MEWKHKVKLSVTGVAHSSTEAGSFCLILTDALNGQKLPIIIGSFEAQAIATALDGLEPTRPLTHDLIKTFLSTFGCSVKEVYIRDVKDGVFFSDVILSGTNGKRVKIDARTSDAIALAVRFKAVVFASKAVMKEAAIDATDHIKPISEIPRADTLEDLKKKLAVAIEKEDYAEAARLRDDIKNKK